MYGRDGRIHVQTAVILYNGRDLTGHNYIRIESKVIILFLCTSSDHALCCAKFHEEILNILK